MRAGPARRAGASGRRLPDQRRTRPGGRSWPAPRCSWWLPWRPPARDVVRPGRRGRGAPTIREFGVCPPRLAACRRTRPVTPSPARRRAPRSCCGCSSGSWCCSAGSYVAAHYVAGDKVPRNTTVAGVRIGGHPQDEAAERLRAGLADRVARDIATTVDGEHGGRRPRRRPASRSTTEASVAEAGGEESWDPVRLWNYFTGGDAFDAEVEVDEPTYNAFLDRSRRAARRHASRRGDRLRRRADRDAPRPARARRSTPATRLTALQGAFLDEDPDVVALTMAEVQPDIDGSDVQEAARRLRLPGGRSARDADVRGLERQGLPGRLHRRPHAGPDQRRAGADPRPGEAQRGRRRPRSRRARRSTPPSRSSAADRRSSRPSRA